MLIAGGSVPMAGILVLGVPTLLEGFSGRGKIRPFLVGFEGVGWTILLLYSGSVILFTDSVGDAIEKVLELMPFDEADIPWPKYISAIVIVLLVQFGAALVGGWMNHLFKFRVAIERR